jgi:hypothetical protein
LSLHHVRDTGIEQKIAPRVRRQRHVIAVEGADAAAQRGEALRRYQAFRPGMLVERHALRGQLPAEPVQFLHQHDLAAEPGCGQRRADAAKAAADDQDFGRDFFSCCAHGFAFALYADVKQKPV